MCFTWRAGPAMMHSKSKSYDTILEANKSSINKFGKVLKQPKEKQQFAEMNDTVVKRNIVQKLELKHLIAWNGNQK